MAKDQPLDAAKAMEFKEKGNKCFADGDYSGAEAYYTNA
jgi:STIP1 family protein 1